MSDKKHREEEERGVVVALLERLTEQRIPRMQHMEKQVESGEPLSDAELEFLAGVMEDWKAHGHLLAGHEELRTVLYKVIDLYHSITQKALANEQTRK